MRKFTCNFYDTNNVTCVIDLPSTCPHCGRSLSPEVMFRSPFGIGYANTNIEKTRIITIYRCTYEDCFKFFILEYSVEPSPYSNEEEYICHKIDYSYTPPISNNLPINISNAFPDFTDIYNQAIMAEQYKLTKISGIGYRKALEFLIKDFIIRKDPQSEENIKNKFLGKVISEDLTDLPRVQQLAKAANWISTDEVHYEQRFSDGDIEAMKRFIKSAATFISATLDADDAEAFIYANDSKNK